MIRAAETISVDIFMREPPLNLYLALAALRCSDSQPRAIALIVCFADRLLIKRIRKSNAALRRLIFYDAVHSIAHLEENGMAARKFVEFFDAANPCQFGHYRS